MEAVRSRWIIAFGTVAVVHLVLNAANAAPWDSITKCLLAPLLIGWVVQLRGPRLIAVALTFCFLGDLFLEFDAAWFPVGMAAFAAGHLCFITFFTRRGALARLKARPWIPILYVIAAVALIGWCWSGLENDIRPLVPIYAVLLAGTASTAIATDLRAGIGGLAFLISDGIIAASQAGRFDADATATGLAIMALYIAAIFLLTVGILDRERRTIAAGSDFDPAVRTDCWPRIPVRS